jgi:hypothetical protein
MTVPFQMTFRGRPTPEPGVHFSQVIDLGKVFTIEYLHVTATSKVSDLLYLTIRTVSFFPDFPISFYLTAVPGFVQPGIFALDRIVKIPTGTQVDVSVGRMNLSAPDLNDSFSCQIFLSGTMQ